MKNTFKPIIKIMDKSKRVIVSRKGGDVYICDGYIAVKVPELPYTMYFSTEKPYFPALEDGQSCISWKDKRKHTPYEMQEEQSKLWECWPRETCPVARTDFSLYVPGGRGDVMVCNGERVIINSDFVAAMDTAFTPGDLRGAGQFKPVVWGNSIFSGIALPIRVAPTDDNGQVMAALDAIIDVYK